jgi:membrane associated rhomboid family serine protease
MGYEGRDYFRDGSYTDSLNRDDEGGRGGYPVVKWIIILNVAVFLGQLFITRDRSAEFQQWQQDLQKQFQEQPQDDDDPPKLNDEEIRRQNKIAEEMVRLAVQGPQGSLFEDWFILDTDKVLHGQVWRLLTHAFCHSRMSIQHIILNMLVLYFFGRTIESVLGSREFLLFYLTAAIIGGLAFVGLDFVLHHHGRALGASGATMGVFVLFAYYYPRSTIYFFWVLPLQAWLLALLYIAYDLHPVLLELTGQGIHTGVAHIAHLGGAAFGLAYGKFHMRLDAAFEGFSFSLPKIRRPARAKLRVYRPEPEREPEPSPDDAFRERVDDILRKVHASGRESLSAEEQALLDEASARFRRKSPRD